MQQIIFPNSIQKSNDISFLKLCKCTCQYICTVQTMCLPAGDVSRTAQYFRLLKLARIVKTLRIIRYWNYTEEGLLGIGTIQKKDYQVLELYRRRIIRYWSYTGEWLTGIGTIQEKDFQVLELLENDYQVLKLYRRRIIQELELYKKKNCHVVEPQNVFSLV